MGNNDYTAGTTVGTANDELFSWVEGYINGINTETPDTFAKGYAIMVAKMANAYPEANIFLFNMIVSNKIFSNITCDLETAEKYNTVINTIASHYGCYVVDLSHSEMSGTSYNNYTVGDNLHPNEAGMDIWTDLVIDAMIDCYLVD